MTSTAAFDLGAWLLRCNPAKWDLHRFIRDGNLTIRSWTVGRYRDQLAAGQPVLFWVTGPTGAVPTPGLWGAGVVTGPPQTDGHHDEYWLIAPPKSAAMHWLPVDITLFSAPVPRTVLAEDPRLRSLEIIQNPRAANPQRVTADQLRTIGRYLDPHVTATYGPIAQARAIVAHRYRRKGWQVEPSTTDGSDLTCWQGAQVLQVVTRPAGRIVLGRPEVAAAADPDWRLIIVDGPDLVELDGPQALGHAEPVTYEIRLP
ncbi:hypothetical protein O7634_12895 [Micromonospora sp. WMMD1120]|uniref:hypothetical protein n=1 Tax=Micromonospora sp. WMMD1120 TaxID=3016106 RepID=UPI002417992C|nr:hypothetical protein [Micromonospora sp. WMMD1120]MDG4807650.1 hypothetical protein [Micromonospora sp. WMMD1120]